MRTINYVFVLTCLVVAVSISQISLVQGRSYDQHDFYAPTPLAKDWVAIDNHYAPAFYKDFNEMVRLRGVAKHVSGELPSVIFTLPEGFRPSQTLKIRVVSSDGASTITGVVNITKTGDVIAVEGKTIFSLDSIAFSAPTRKSVLVNGAPVHLGLRFPKPDSSCISFWERYWSPRDPTVRACHETDVDDEILLTGTVAPPRTDSPSRIVGILDRPQRPNRDIRVCAPSTQGPVVLHIRTSGDIFARGFRGGSIFLDGVSFIKNQVSNWREVPQWKNGFSEAAADWFITDSRFKDVYTTPGFRKDGEGRIFLKGIVAPPKPFVLGTLFVLPQGYRPSETIYRCGATRRGFVTISINPEGEVAVENIAGSEYIDWLSLDGLNFLGAETQGELIAKDSTLKFYDVDTLFTSVEGTYSLGQTLALSRPPLRKSGYFAFVQNTPVLVRVNPDGEVKVEEFPRVDSDNVLVGNDWKPIFFLSKVNNIVYESASERPSFMIDRNNNIVLLRGLFPHSATSGKDMFTLPNWVQLEKDVLVVATGHKSYFPLIIRTTGEVQWAGEVPKVDTLVLLDGLHFPAVIAEEPPTKHILI